jgi:hypothetical protein
MKKFINKYIIIFSFSRLLRNSWVLSKNYRWKKKFLFRLSIAFRFSVKDKFKFIRISIPYIVKRTNMTQEEMDGLRKSEEYCRKLRLKEIENQDK